MIAVESVRSAHDEVMGAVVLVVICLALYSSRKSKALTVLLLVAPFAVAVMIEVYNPGLIDGRP